jgi:hypothetical protein
MKLADIKVGASYEITAQRNPERGGWPTNFEPGRVKVKKIEGRYVRCVYEKDLAGRGWRCGPPGIEVLVSSRSLIRPFEEVLEERKIEGAILADYEAQEKKRTARTHKAIAKLKKAGVEVESWKLLMSEQEEYTSVQLRIPFGLLLALADSLEGSSSLQAQASPSALEALLAV